MGPLCAHNKVMDIVLVDGGGLWISPRSIRVYDSFCMRGNKAEGFIHLRKQFALCAGLQWLRSDDDRGFVVFENVAKSQVKLVCVGQPRRGARTGGFGSSIHLIS